jgi:hypothetical protein
MRPICGADVCDFFGCAWIRYTIIWLKIHICQAATSIAGCTTTLRWRLQRCSATVPCVSTVFLLIHQD